MRDRLGRLRPEGYVSAEWPLVLSGDRATIWGGASPRTLRFALDVARGVEGVAILPGDWPDRDDGDDMGQGEDLDTLRAIWADEL